MIPFFSYNPNNDCIIQSVVQYQNRVAPEKAALLSLRHPLSSTVAKTYSLTDHIIFEDMVQKRNIIAADSFLSFSI